MLQLIYVREQNTRAITGWLTLMVFDIPQHALHVSQPTAYPQGRVIREHVYHEKHLLKLDGDLLLAPSQGLGTTCGNMGHRHVNILPILSRTRPLQEKIKLRAVSLIKKMKTIENCKTRSLVEQVKDDRRSISYVNYHSRLFIPVCDVYKGQAIRELSECLWGRRYLDGFGQHEILELIEWISVLWHSPVDAGVILHPFTLYVN